MIATSERPTDTPDLGSVLRELRRRRGLSQLDLAAAADVSARHLSFVENGRSRPGRELLLRLADRLDADAAQRDTLLVAAGHAPLRPGATGAVVDGIGGVLGPGDTGDTGAPAASAVEAGRRALLSAGSPAVDTVVVATATPGRPGRPAAPEVADRLGLGDAAAFDLATVCGGFLYGLANAVGLVASGASERVLLIASDAGSPEPCPPWTTAARQWLAGAGAVVLRAGSADEPGALGTVVLGTDARRAVPSAERLYAASLRAMEAVGWTAGDIDRLAADRGEPEAVVALAGRLNVSADRRLGPAGGSAGLASSLARAARDGTLAAGHRVLLTAYEGDRTWAAAALRWPRLRG
ncbi:helix-turn-helix domain-containing protein [Streptomyces phaeofaciens]|uniref:helix-turn-helix domain-containing protein n=1 Tax=Streptomyces phaeofaciens TaxID=68254 RepID=UPI00368CCB16